MPQRKGDDKLKYFSYIVGPWLYFSTFVEKSNTGTICQKEQ